MPYLACVARVAIIYLTHQYFCSKIVCMTTRSISMPQNLTFHDVMRWSDEDCRRFLEVMRWGDNPTCPKCGSENPYRITRKSRTKNHVSHLFKCRECKRQFSTTVGTIFEDSKIPLHKWFAAIYLMCASKKSISAHQVHRTINITYKSAWFMCHRIRQAMTDSDDFPFSGIVEADETYVGSKTRRGHKVMHERIKDEEQMGLRPKTKYQPLAGKTPVFGMLERGGRVRSQVVDAPRAENLRPIILDNVDVQKTMLITDRHSAYRNMKHDLPHEAVNHEIEYVRRDDPSIHTQNIESYWSIFKRGVIGTFHHVSTGYLPMYLREFDFRANRRKITDGERFASLMSQTRGRLLWYCKTEQHANPYA